MIVRFKKSEDLNGSWCVDIKTWRGELEDLKVPQSLSSLIEEESDLISLNSVSFEISEFFFESSKLLEKIYNEEMEEGRYTSPYGEVYICDLLYYFFPSGYPNKIYYQIRDES